MHVGVITNRNLESPWASTHYYINGALSGHGVTTTHVAGREIKKEIARNNPRWTGRSQRAKQPSPFTPEITSAVKRDIERNHYDLLLALHASTVIPSIQFDCPLVYVTDAPALLLNNYPPYREAISDAQRGYLHECEKVVIARSDAILVPSQWAADSVLQDYGASPECVHTVEWGGNLDRIPATGSTLPEEDETVRLLFVGFDWYRKGGDTAIQVVKRLREAGIKASLTVVGADIPKCDRYEHATGVGMLNRAKPEQSAQLDALFRSADLYLHPARAECFGHVLCEAVGFGLPAVATDTGGIPQCITDGETGVLLPRDASAEDFAEKVIQLLGDRSLMAEMSSNGIRDFNERLNWNCWGTRATQIMQGLLSPTASASPL